MKFSDAFLDQVKGAFRLSDYVGKTLPLKKSGREYVGLSPFTKERTPSFYVNDEKAFFHDFSSGRHGDIVDWLTETQGLTFVEAIRRLAEEAGISLPERDARSAEADSRRQHLENVLGAAQNYFQISLARSEEAKAYLAGRGLSAADCDRFGIGYAPEARYGLVSELLARGFDHESAVAAGVAIRVDDQPKPYDRYRHRITFPISDASGRPISFGGRALDPKAKAKYLNGPDTDIFDKGRNLYGLDVARKLLAQGQGPLLVAEGYMDVIAVLRAGIACCAPMGTSLTEAQLQLMWRYHPEPTLCFDGDRAGRQAAARAMDMAIPRVQAGRTIRFGSIIGAKDPDELLRNRGPEALRAQLVKATPLVDAIFERERAAAPLDTPEQRADLRERLRKIVRLIQERDIANEYGEAFKSKLEGLRRRPAGEAPASAASVDSARALRASIPPAIQALAYWLIRDPARAAADIELVEFGLGHPALDRMIEGVTAWLLIHDPDPEHLAQHLHANGLGELVVGLADPGNMLADPEDWRRAWLARIEYLRLEREVQQAKGAIRSPADMQHFLALKTQRDRAKAAL